MTNTHELSYNDFERIVFNGVGDDYEEYIITTTDSDKYHNFSVQIFYDQIDDDDWNDIFDSIRNEMNNKGFKTKTIYSDLPYEGGQIHIMK